jgi:hypothetical protein
MSEKKSLKAMPKGAETVFVTKLSAARSQLESAIWLWFHEVDPVSIHTLAVAAHDCFNALVKHAVGKPSNLQQWLAEESEGRRKRIRIAQNFFKHGSFDLKAEIPLHSIDTEAFMMDAVMSFEILTKERSALMRLYGQRFLYEHPTLITEEAVPVFEKNAEVHQLFDSSRKEFFERLYPIFVQRFGSA